MNDGEFKGRTIGPRWLNDEDGRRNLPNYVTRQPAGYAALTRPTIYNGEHPVGVVLWALADDIVAKRIDAGDIGLTEVEWKSGANMRIVDVVARFGTRREMIKDRRAD